jgi:AIPR protein
LIVTTNQEVTNRIIKATNRQTEVKVEAFEALEPFHKELEAYYGTYATNGERLYYERRSKQFDNEPDVRMTRVVSISRQIKCFVSMFLAEPHTAHGYYGKLLALYREERRQLFVTGQDPYAYYVSAYGRYVLEQLFRSGRINKNLRRFRYHLLLFFRILASDTADVPKTLLKGKKRRNSVQKSTRSWLTPIPP